jgi:hypothetical protein
MKNRSPALAGLRLAPRVASRDRLETTSPEKFEGINSRREAIYLALSAAELCWAAPLFMTLSEAGRRHSPWLLWLGMLVLLLGFFYLYRALEKANLSLRLHQSLMLVALLLMLLFFFRFHIYARAGLQGADWLLEPFRRFTDLGAAWAEDLLAILTLIYLWARGIHLARRSITAQAVGFSFRAGVVIFVWCGLLTLLFSHGDMAGFVAPFFFFSLVAIALARVEEISHMPGSSKVRGSSFWIGSTVAAVAFLVLLGLLLSVFFTGGGLERVLRFFSPLLTLVQLLIFGLVFLVLGFFELLLSLVPIDLSAWLERLRRATEALQLDAGPLPQAEAQTAAQLRLLGTVQLGVIVAIIVGFIALVLLFTWWRVHRNGEEELGESRESLLSAGAVARSLLAMLRSGRERLGEMAGLVDRFGLGSRLLSAISIQRIYASLVRLAAGAGYPRVKAQTPFEYLVVLCEAWPDNESDLTLITNAYVNAHYGEVPDTREELERIRGCWERVRGQRARK